MRTARRPGPPRVRLDSRDAGKSARADAPGAYSLHDLAADVVACLDALELPAATLAGVSQGGMIAQIVAVEHPERVDGLVLISTTVLGDDDLPGPVEGLFSGGPEPPDWSDRAAVARVPARAGAAVRRRARSTRSS